MDTNKSLQERKDTVIAKGLSNIAPVFVKEALNAEVWDIEGNHYIDFGAGIAVCNTGHSHQKIVNAVKAQLNLFSHTCMMVTPYQCAIELAEQLVKVSPGKSAKKVCYVTTGAEAVENAIKIARAHTKRRAVIAFQGGFHGRTNLTMGLTGKINPYKKSFGPFPNDIYHVPFPTEYHGITEQYSLEFIHDLFRVSVDPDDVAAIIFEPIQGEGGFYSASTSFIQAIRKICDVHGIVMIADEIQTGFARTGEMFRMGLHKVEPDLLTMAKGIAGGFPLSAVIGKQEIMDAPLPGGLGGTYAASPIACVAALEVLKIIEEENLCQKALKIGEIFKGALIKLKNEYPEIVGDIRIHGAMIALELVLDGSANVPNTKLTKALVTKSYENGLILLSCGSRNNVIRFLPPLTAEEGIIEAGLSIFRKCFIELVGK